MDKKTIIGVLAVILVLGFFGWQRWGGVETVENVGEDDVVGLFTTEEAVNPFEESTNPYADIKTNPFE